MSTLIPVVDFTDLLSDGLSGEEEESACLRAHNVSGYFMNPHFIDGEIEDQRGGANCPRSHSWDVVHQGL